MDINKPVRDIKELAAALAKAQAELPTAGKNTTANYGKYADIVEAVEASRPVLTKYGLSVSQYPSFIIAPDNALYHSLVTILMHASGQYIDSEMMLSPEKNTNQKNYNHALGGCITYFRRYAYMAIIGMVAENDDDDSGSRSTANNYYAAAQTITSEQEEILRQKISDRKDIMQGIQKVLNITMLSEVPKSRFSDTLAYVERNAAAK